MIFKLLRKFWHAHASRSSFFDFFKLKLCSIDWQWILMTQKGMANGENKSKKKKFAVSKNCWVWHFVSATFTFSMEQPTQQQPEQPQLQTWVQISPSFSASIFFLDLTLFPSYVQMPMCCWKSKWLEELVLFTTMFFFSIVCFFLFFLLWTLQIHSFTQI